MKGKINQKKSSMEETWNSIENFFYHDIYYSFKKTARESKLYKYHHDYIVINFFKKNNSYFDIFFKASLMRSLTSEILGST
jgi:hypothetical protein